MRRVLHPNPSRLTTNPPSSQVASSPDSIRLDPGWRLAALDTSADDTTVLAGPTPDIDPSMAQLRALGRDVRDAGDLQRWKLRKAVLVTPPGAKKKRVSRASVHLSSSAKGAECGHALLREGN